MTKLAVSLALSLALVAALALPAAGFAAEEGEGTPGEGPALVFSPAPVTLPKTTVWTESQTVTVDVVNEGDAPALVDKATIEGPDAGEFKLHGSDCGQLDPAQHCSVQVSFAPGSTGEKQATLGIVPKEGPTWTVPIAGAAVPPQISFSPSVYDFGVQQVNRGESGNVQLINSGEAAIQVGSIGIAGADSGNFGTGFNDCFGPGGRWLQPGEGCNVQVYFNPYAMVSYEAQLQAQAYGETFSADLLGSGGRAIVEAEANPVDFGSASVGSTGTVKTIVLTNHGNLSGNFFIVVIAGGSVGSFQLIDEDCSVAPVEPGGTCTAQVRFVPQGTGPKAARLALFGNDDGGTMVMLTGEGLPALEAPAAATGGSPPAALRAKQRRFGRGTGLFAGRARCHGAKLCRRGRALRARTVVAGD
jgi:hypothetical protein